MLQGPEDKQLVSSVGWKGYNVSCEAWRSCCSPEEVVYSVKHAKPRMVWWHIYQHVCMKMFMLATQVFRFGFISQEESSSFSLGRSHSCLQHKKLQMLLLPYCTSQTCFVCGKQIKWDFHQKPVFCIPVNLRILIRKGMNIKYCSWEGQINQARSNSKSHHYW